MKNIYFFLKYHQFHQDSFLAHLLRNVTYVTALNKFSDPGLKLADIQFYIILA